MGSPQLQARIRELCAMSIDAAQEDLSAILMELRAAIQHIEELQAHAAARLKWN